MANASASHGDTHAGSHEHPPARPFVRLRQLLRPESHDLSAIVAFALAVAILSLATPIAVESLVNTVAFGVLMWPVVVLAGVLLTCLGLAAAIRAMQIYVVEAIQRRLFVRVVADYAHRLPSVRLDAFDSRHGPELGNRFFDILTFQKSLAILLLDGLALVVTAVVGMVVLAFYHPFLLGFDLALVAAIGVLLFGLGWGGVRTSLHESHAKYDVAAWLEELFRALRTFKFDGGRSLAIGRADLVADEFVTARRAHFRVVWRQTLFALGLQVVASTALLGLGGYLVIDRQLTLGQLVAAELIVALVVASVAKLGKYAETWYDLLASAEKLGLVTDLPLERAGGEALPEGDRGLSVRVVGIDAVSGRTLTLHADWNIAPGERVAVVAPAGSGKTTLFEVVCGLREPGDGIVELDGIDVRELALQRLRERIALVRQTEIVCGTVNENVRFGRADRSAHEVREVLAAVGLLGVVRDLPLGLETAMVPEGGPLSASRSLRVTIARALLGRPRLLILDGVLDALDFDDCPDLLPRLFDRAAPWTLLVASNRPEIVGMCDRTVGPSHVEAPQRGSNR